MTNQFYCINKDRWKIIDDQPQVPGRDMINGIDYLEVSSRDPTASPPDQKQLKLFFLLELPDGLGSGHPASKPKLEKGNVFIEGGVRVQSIRVEEVKIDSTNKKCLIVNVSEAGDFSTYTLKVGSSSIKKDTPPEGFDLQLSSVDFSFKIDCPNEFDCKTEAECAPETTDEPSIDYLAKDFSSFRKLMLDRISVISTDWKERHTADLQITLVELLAYVADHLSYYQDAVATEAYLHTARRRISTIRHSRMLDYFVHNGCNARVWVQVQVEEGGVADGAVLQKGKSLMTNGDDNSIVIASADKAKFVNEKAPELFETMHDIKLNSAHNRISFYTWGDSNCCLPKGATRASLIDYTFSSPPGSPITLKNLSLEKGDVLIFEELYSPLNGSKPDADQSNRHAVRIKSVQPGIDQLTQTGFLNIEWYEEDALPFTLCITSPKENIYQPFDENRTLQANEKAVARGNIVLADHGVTIRQEKLSAGPALEDEQYYPQLAGKNTTVAVTYQNETAKSNSASFVIKQDPRKALPIVSLNSEGEVWLPQRDLLGSDRFSTEFVVETESNGVSYLRFGNNTQGKKPKSGFNPAVTYRKGNGKSGNIGAESINVLEWNGGGILKVRNPLPAYGGMDPETMEEVRQFAPQAFRVQERAVTAEDYVAKTELHPEVQKAAARFYWTGSWYTVYIIIDRKAGLVIDEAFKQSIRFHLEQYRMAGYDLEIRQPRFVPLQIVMNICVKEGYHRSEVKKRLSKAFSNGLLVNGNRAFFHPDNFTFGQPLYASAMYKLAMEIDGVGSAEMKTFKRWAKDTENELLDGYIEPDELEILRLDNDPNFPENGKIDFVILGGL